MNKPPDDTIVAVSTPMGEGGIGIVRLSGPASIRIADEVFVSKDGTTPSRLRTFSVKYGHIVDKKIGARVKGQGSRENGMIDEVILTIMKAPKTYTKEDVVEINCHGGIQAVKNVLELIMKQGARMAEPGEFTKRAFLNGRLDLAQAEAVLDTIRAKTDSSLKVAMNQLEGGLSMKINEIRDSVVDIAATVEASIDFPDEELEIITSKVKAKVDTALSDIKRLIDTSNEGIILREGILCVICGKPNAGKSSLMNLLLNRDRVIVTPIPGTTRDAVEEMINLKGIPIRLVDTAGIAQTSCIVEKEGIKRSKTYLDMSDLVLFVLDSSIGIDSKDEEIMKLIGKKKKIVVINKIDLGRHIHKDDLKQFSEDDKIVEVSVTSKMNINSLEKAIVDAIWSGQVRQNEGAVVSNARHKELLDKALLNMSAVKDAVKDNMSPELIAVDLKEAVFNLGLITGKSVSDDILNRIFEQFCIGK